MLDRRDFGGEGIHCLSVGRVQHVTELPTSSSVLHALLGGAHPLWVSARDVNLVAASGELFCNRQPDA
jgi:hypothetical protein